MTEVKHVADSADSADSTDSVSQIESAPDTSRRKAIRNIAVGGASILAAPGLILPARAAGRAVKIGFVSPQTGPIAAFGEADRFVLDGVRKAIGRGIMIAGTEHPITIINKDSQSNPNRAAEVAAQLIKNDQIGRAHV